MRGRTWDAYLAVLAEGPSTIQDLSIRVHGDEPDEHIRLCNAQNTSKALQRMFHVGVVDRPSLGVYAVPGGKSPIPSTIDVHAALRRRSKEGARIVDLMRDLECSADVVKKRLQRLRRGGLCRLKEEPHAPGHRYERVFRYFPCKDERAALLAFGEIGTKRYRSTGATLASDARGEVELLLRQIDALLPHVGMDGWTATVVLRNPATDERAVLTQDPIDVLAPPPPPRQIDAANHRRGDQHWTRRDPERAKASAAALRARKTA